MKRGSRRDSNYDNVVNNPRSRQKRPASYHELKLSLITVRTNFEEAASQRDEAEQLAKETASQLVHIQQKIQTYQIEANELKERIAQNYRFYAVNSLYVVAERMDRIQSLVDSVEEETTNNPMGLVQKFKRIWLAIKDILSE